MPLLPAYHLEIRKVHQVQEIDRRDIIDLGLPALESQQLGKLQNRLPQVRIIGNDDARGGFAQVMHKLQCAIDIFKHADRVGNHDVIKRTLKGGQDGRIFRVTQNEMQTGVKFAGPGDRPRAEINPYSMGGPQ